MSQNISGTSCRVSSDRQTPSSASWWSQTGRSTTPRPRSTSSTHAASDRTHASNFGMNTPTASSTLSSRRAASNSDATRTSRSFAVPTANTGRRSACPSTKASSGTSSLPWQRTRRRTFQTPHRPRHTSSRPESRTTMPISSEVAPAGSETCTATPRGHRHRRRRGRGSGNEIRKKRRHEKICPTFYK